MHLELPVIEKLFDSSAYRPRRGAFACATSCLLLFLFCVGLPQALGQSKYDKGNGLDGLGLPSVSPDFSLGPPGSSEPVTYSAEFEVVSGSNKGQLYVTAIVTPGWHTYSVTQPPGGPLPTRISIAGTDAKIVGEPEPNHAPEIGSNEIWEGVPIEEHHDEVIWTLPIEFSNAPTPETTLAVEVKGLVCQDTACKPTSGSITAKFAGYMEGGDSAESAPPMVDAGSVPPISSPPVDSTEHRVGVTHAVWTAALDSSRVAPGQLAKLTVTATLDPAYHLYEYVAGDDETTFRTNIVVSQKGGLKFGEPQVDGELEPYPGLPSVQQFSGTVSWDIPILAPADLTAGQQDFEVQVAFTTCAKACDPPSALSVRGALLVGADAKGNSKLELSDLSYREAIDQDLSGWMDLGVEFSDAKPKSAAVPMPQMPEIPGPNGSNILDLENDVEVDNATPPGVEIAADDEPDSDDLLAEMAGLYNGAEKIRYLNAGDMDKYPVGSGGESSSSDTTLWTAIFGAFVGGMLLNLMPCVFPVLGLKVMSFVKQAGGEPAKIRMHGLAFTAGLVVSMWILVGVIFALKSLLGQEFGWGAQLSDPYFVAAIIVLLFLLGLNMAGVFEFGNSLTRVGGVVDGKEGYSASFFSGVITTLVATPCSGPFLGTAMSYTLSQPIVLAMILFTIFALGIAAPYLMLSFSPALISKLPKPGAWMETFKVTMAFLLFATVAFFIHTFGNLTGPSGTSWLIMGLVIIGLAAYYYGRFSLPHIAASKRLMAGYALPLVIAVGGGWVCYQATLLREERLSTPVQIGEDLRWKNWEPGRVEYLLAKTGRAVWVDYTADW